MKRRQLGILILLAASMALGYWLGNFARSEKSQLTGELSFAPELTSKTYLIGDYILRWHSGKGGQISVWNTVQPNTSVWETIPGKAFVAAAQGQETVKENRSMYKFRDDLQEICNQQSIASIEQNEAGSIILRGVLACNSGQLAPYAMFFQTSSDDPRRLEFTVAVDPPLNRIFLTYASDKDEHFFGFGEQFTYFDLKGQLVPIWVSEQGIGRGEQPITLGANLTNGGAGGNALTSYAPIPFYITSRMRSMLLYNSDYALFDLRKTDSVQLKVFANALQVRLFTGADPAEIIDQYTRFISHMSPLPDWVHSGAIVGMQGGTDTVRNVYAQLQALDTPIAAFWLQDWVGQRTTSFGKQLWWNWEVDYDRYPGWDQLVADLNADGVQVMVYVSPYLADIGDLKPNVRRNLFQEAKEKGYLIKNAEGEPYLVLNTDFYFGMVDLSNTAAAAWYRDVLHEQVVASGASGWMADFGEGLPYDAALDSSTGMTADRLHNVYPVAWAALNRIVVNDVKSKTNKDLVFFNRAAYTSSPAYATLFWEGDQLVSWSEFDGIKSAVTGLNSSGLSGMAFNHSDIGGYTTVSNPFVTYHRTKELLLRWMEMNAFTTIFRTHEGNQPENNVQFYSDEETLSAFAYWAKVYAALFDYRKELIAEASKDGLPVVRHPFIQHPDDPETWKITYQEFMLGSDFLIAPVTDESATEVTAYLPAGDWVHLWSGESYSGGQYVTVAAPLGQPGVFYQAGSAWGADFAQKLKSQNLMP